MIRRARAWLVVVAAVIALAFAATTSLVRLGHDQAQTEIIIQNQEAADAADRSSSEFQRCIDDGGLFDFATGKCRGP